MPNFTISDLPPAVLPLDTVNTFFELQTFEAGIAVSRKISAQDLGIGGGVVSVVGGVNITVDATDPLNPIVNLPASISGMTVNGVVLDTGGAATEYLDRTGNYSTPASGGGQVDSVVGGTNITVDATDPINPIVNLDAALTGVSVNGVTLTNAGVATNYLDETGAYSVPPSGGQVDSVAGGTNINITGTAVDPIVNLDAAITGVSVNGVTLTTGGAATDFLDATGNYSTPAGGASTLAALTDVDLTGQAQYDLFFNVDGTNWEDTGGVLRLDIASQFLELGSGYGLNIVDSGATSRPVVEIASSGTPSQTIEHPTVEVVAEVSTTSNTEVDVPGAVLPILTEGDEYLIMAVAQHHQGNTGGENIHGADIAIASQSGVPFSNCRDDIEPPACAPASNQGAWFTGLNQIQYANATHGQIRLEHSAGATATHYVNNAALMAFNLTQFGTENVDWFSSVTAPFVTVNDTGWSNLSPNITIGDGVSDWLIFGTFQCDQPQAGGQIQFGLFDGSTNTEYAMHQFADTADIKSIVFSAVVQGISSTTFRTAARAVAASGNTARIFTSGIYALRLNRFAQYSITSGAGPTSPGSGAEFSLLTDSIVATTNSDWGLFTFARNNWAGNSLSGTFYGRANINAGGFTTISGFDTPPQAVVENATAEWTPRPLVPRITELTGVVPTDTVGAEFRWIPPTTFGSAVAELYHMVMFTWDTVDTSVEETTFGDPALDTRIDGLSVTTSANVSITTGASLEVFDAADSNSVQIEINSTTMAPNDAVVFQRNGGWASGSVYSFDAAINIDTGTGLYLSNSTGGVFFYRLGDAISHSLRRDTGGVHLQCVAGRFRLTADSIQQGEVAAPASDVISQGQWWVRDHVPNQPWFTDGAGNDYPIGYGRPRFFTTNASYDMNTGNNAEACINGEAYFDDGSPYTITLENSTGTGFDVNTPFQIVNAGSGTITVAEGTGDTLFVLDGTAGTVTDAAGSATIGTGGVATVQRTAAGTWIMWGSGITP